MFWMPPYHPQVASPYAKHQNTWASGMYRGRFKGAGAMVASGCTCTGTCACQGWSPVRGAWPHSRWPTQTKSPDQVRAAGKYFGEPCCTRAWHPICHAHTHATYPGGQIPRWPFRPDACRRPLMFGMQGPQPAGRPYLALFLVAFCLPFDFSLFFSVYLERESSSTSVLPAGPPASWKSLLGLAPKAPAAPVRAQGLSPEEDPDTIHIFTVASGHMYERLQKIMVLSVLRHTRCGPP